jgi:regulator of replication initiation timing
MDTGLATILVALLTAPVATLVTWSLSRRKNKADFVNTLSSAGLTAVETMQKTMGELRNELEQARVQINKLIEDNSQLRTALAEIKAQNIILIDENKTLKLDLEMLMKKLNS